MNKTSISLKEELYIAIQNVLEDQPSERVIGVAHEVVDLIPENCLVDDLDVDITPFGSIDFGWCLDKGVYLNILVENRSRNKVSPNDSHPQIISYAWMNRGECGTGQREWDGRLPKNLLHVMNWMMGNLQLKENI